MTYLILTIAITVLVILTFKWFEKCKIDTFQAIISNYFTCILVGYLFLEDKAGLTEVYRNGFPAWGFWAMALGILFIFSFYMIGRTAQEAGISVVSVASKISMAIPISISLLVLKTSLKEFTFLNYVGLLGALVAVVFTSLRNKKDKTPRTYNILLPLMVFLTTGISDTILNYVNYAFLKKGEEAFYTISLFGFATLAGIAVLIIGIASGKVRMKLRNVIAGFLLGVPNYFSIYFLMKSLSAFENDGAFLFPILNIGVILASTVAGILIFREKLSTLNYLGLAIATASILFLSYQELFF